MRINELDRSMAKIDAAMDQAATGQVVKSSVLSLHRELGTPLVCADLIDFIRLPLPNLEPILGEWLVEKSLGMLHAWRGAGKTWAVMSMAYAIASGQDFLKWRCTRARRVLYLDGEMQAGAMQFRLARIAKMFPNAPARGYLKIVTPDLQEGRGMPDLATVEGQADLDRTIKDAEPELIIVDNLSCLARSGRENESESWQPVADWALRMRREGRSVLFVHHSGKGGSQRGTSKREDILDAVIALKVPKGMDGTNGAQFELVFEKARHSHGADVDPIEAKLVEDADGNLGWSYEDALANRYDRAKEMHEAGMSCREIADELGISAATVSRTLKRGK
jgi:hypothetical protein